MMGITEEGSLHILSKESIKRRMELNIDQCKPGMFMAETIYNKMGAIVIMENTELDLPTIQRLKRLDYDNVKVYEKSDMDVNDDTLYKFKEVYSQNLITLKEVFQEIYSGQPLDMDKVDQLSDSIDDTNTSDGAYLKCIGKIQYLDELLYSHSLNVSMLSCLIAKWMKLGKEQTNEVIKAGLLHDIGKTKLSTSIQCVHERFSEPENREFKKHVKYGWEIVSDTIGTKSSIGDAILMHHEKDDGSGYPHGLKCDEINLPAKIISVADLFDTLTSTFINQKAISPFEAFGILESEGFKGYNAMVIMKFLENAPNYFVGERFFLDNGETGEIIFINPKIVHRPLIKIGDRYIDLSCDKTINLENMI